jgi:hypothetical protein
MDDTGEAGHIGVRHLTLESPVQRGDERCDTIEAFAQEILPQFAQAPTP